MKTFRCNICNGHGAVATPTGALWQTCPICAGAGQVTPEPEKAPGWYPLQLVVPLNGTLPGSILIVNEDFDVEQILATYTSPLLNITINQSGRPWTIGPNVNSNQGTVPVTLLAGTAASPFIVYPAYRLRVKEQITVIATDLSGAQNTLFFALVGKRLIGQQSASRQ